MHRTVRRIAILGPDLLNAEEMSDVSLIAACLALMGHEVVLLGAASDTSIAVERGMGDVGHEAEIASYALSELDSVDSAILFEEPELLERINDLGIIVDDTWVFLKNAKALSDFADAGAELMAGRQITV